MKIVFMGSSEFAIPTLDRLASNPQDFHLISVYTAPPKPAGRGMGLTRTPVHERALELGIPVNTPITLKNHQLEDCNAVVLVAYGKILPQHILDQPKYGCINLHPSLLPRWRGASPIQHTLMYGDTETGVSIIRMNEKLDEGDILSQVSVPVAKTDTISTLSENLADIGAQTMLSVLLSIERIIPTIQSSYGATYAHKIEKHPIDWSWSVDRISGYIKALNGALAVFSSEKQLKIIRASYNNKDPLKEPGKVLSNDLHIACLGGILVPEIVQLDGKKAMSVEEFLRGNSDFSKGLY